MSPSLGGVASSGDLGLSSSLGWMVSSGDLGLSPCLGWLVFAEDLGRSSPSCGASDSCAHVERVADHGEKGLFGLGYGQEL